MKKSKVIDINEKLKQKQFEAEIEYLAHHLDLEVDKDYDAIHDIYTEFKNIEDTYFPHNDDIESDYTKELQFDDEY